MIPDNLKFSVLINKEKGWPVQDDWKAVRRLLWIDLVLRSEHTESAFTRVFGRYACARLEGRPQARS